MDAASVREVGSESSRDGNGGSWGARDSTSGGAVKEEFSKKQK